MNTTLRTAFGEDHRFIHKITLSGLYGPVPEEFESEEAVVRYDFQLWCLETPPKFNSVQIGSTPILINIKQHYELIVGYATSNAYRKVLGTSPKASSGFHLATNET